MFLNIKYSEDFFIKGKQLKWGYIRSQHITMYFICGIVDEYVFWSNKQVTNIY